MSADRDPDGVGLTRQVCETSCGSVESLVGNELMAMFVF